jgi:hypothetical protein
MVIFHGRPELAEVDYVDSDGLVVYYHLIADSKTTGHCVRNGFKPMSRNIPPRYREHVFHSVAHVWKHILDSYPKLVRVDPRPLTLETYAKKLRDSREAKNTYGWTHPLVDEELWQKHSERIKIGQDLERNEVLAGPSESFGDNKHAAIGIVANQPEIMFRWRNFRELEALCLVISQMTPRQVFVVSDLSDDQIASLESRYEVGIVEYTKGVWHIV